MKKTNLKRRELLRSGLCSFAAMNALPWLSNPSFAQAALQNDRILVVVELSGGNDGLNTVIPIESDEYYRLRPRIGIAKSEALKISDEFGFHPSLNAFQQLYDDGNMAVVHGCGYDQPSLSHFTSMSYWHTGVPNGGEALGWTGRFADARWPAAEQDNILLNIGNSQSLAVRSALHTPLVFANPDQLVREGDEQQQEIFQRMSQSRESSNSSLQFLQNVAANAASSSQFVRDAAAAYKSPVDYGLSAMGADLRNVAALIDAGIGTKIFYVSYAGNAFDTHVYQPDIHGRLLLYAADAINGFLKDIDRQGRSQQVAMMAFTEFGRRVEENASLGTDHGTATPMFVFGDAVNGGLYSEHPSLIELNDGNLIKTTDFRRVYASMISEWMGFTDTASVLHGEYKGLGLFS